MSRDYIDRIKSERHEIPLLNKSPELPKDTQKGEQYKQLDRVIRQYSSEPGQLIRILQKAQDVFGYLPEEVQAYIAEKTDTPVAEVNGVVTFYSLFATKPKGKIMLNLCMGTACYVKGAQELMNFLKDQLEIDEGETSPDKLFTIKSTRCVGACGLAPVLMVNEEVHGKAGISDIDKIIEKHRGKGENIENPKH